MRIAVMTLALVLGAAALGFGALYLVSEARLRAVQPDPAFGHAIPADPVSFENGRHIARTRGCFGCHGQKLEGKDFGEQWDWPERAVAPNLALYARAHDAAAIEAAVRQGIGRNGQALTSMPSYNFAHLTDDDMADLIAFLRSAPVAETPLPRPRLGWPVRWSFATGAETHMADIADLVPPLRIDQHTQPAMAHGEYLAMTMCNECHGLDVRGQTVMGPPTPDLAIAAAYSREDFQTLLETGRASDGRRLGLMSLVAPDRFRDLSEQELDDLHLFLSSLPDEPVPENVPWRPDF